MINNYTLYCILKSSNLTDLASGEIKDVLERLKAFVEVNEKRLKEGDLDATGVICLLYVTELVHKLNIELLINRG